ncbi:MAG: acylphosphatase [Stellaceae bacterium]
MDREIATRIVVSGRVQGVGYRLWTVREAERKRVRGWVRNRRDGTVEALLIGNEEAVEALIATCREGPRLAEVREIAREPASDDGSLRFHEKSTV